MKAIFTFFIALIMQFSFARMKPVPAPKMQAGIYFGHCNLRGDLVENPFSPHYGLYGNYHFSTRFSVGVDLGLYTYKGYTGQVFEMVRLPGDVDPRPAITRRDYRLQSKAGQMQLTLGYNITPSWLVDYASSWEITAIGGIGLGSFNSKAEYYNTQDSMERYPGLGFHHYTKDQTMHESYDGHHLFSILGINIEHRFDNGITIALQYQHQFMQTNYIDILTGSDIPNQKHNDCMDNFTIKLGYIFARQSKFKLP